MSQLEKEGRKVHGYMGWGEMIFPKWSFPALTTSALVAFGIIVFALLPPGTLEGPVRHDGPWNHGIAFSALVMPLAAVWPRRLLQIIVIAMLFGASIEVLQPFVGRASQLEDLVSNAIGVMIGVAIGLLASPLAQEARGSPNGGRHRERTHRR